MIRGAAANQQVIAPTAFQLVFAAATNQDVAASPAVQLVVANAADQNVIASTAPSIRPTPCTTAVVVNVSIPLLPSSRETVIVKMPPVE